MAAQLSDWFKQITENGQVTFYGDTGQKRSLEQIESETIDLREILTQGKDVKASM